MVGSSYSTISGLRIRARASPTRLRMPPDNSAGLLLATLFRQARPQPAAASPLLRISSADECSCWRSGKATFWTIVMLSNRAAF